MNPKWKSHTLLEPTDLVDSLASHLARFRVSFAKTVKAKAIRNALALARELDKALALPELRFPNMTPPETLVWNLVRAERRVRPSQRDADMKAATKALDKVSVLIAHSTQEKV